MTTINQIDNLRSAVEEFYFDYAWNLDRRETADWIAFYAEDGVYSLTTRQNANGAGMFLVFEEGRAAITRRAAVASGYLRAQQNKMLHMISNVRARLVNDGEVEVTAYCAVFRTSRQKTSEFHACGEFHDRLALIDGRLTFREHNVIFDAETLPANMADLY
jgi:3-phenylpropionate/cinnamic acid dioxygenase small subunit